MRLKFLLAHCRSPLPDSGLPLVDEQLWAQSFFLPAAKSAALGILPEQGLVRLIDEPGRASAAAFSVALWSGQQALCSLLAEQGLDARGFPPSAARAVESVYIPDGTLWIGAMVSSPRLNDGFESAAAALASLFGVQLRSDKPASYPWMPDVSSAGGWALAIPRAKPGKPRPGKELPGED